VELVASSPGRGGAGGRAKLFLAAGGLVAVGRARIFDRRCRQPYQPARRKAESAAVCRWR